MIAIELRDAAAGATRGHILGAPELAALYQQAAASLGIEARVLGADAAARALFRLGVMLQG